MFPTAVDTNAPLLHKQCGPNILCVHMLPVTSVPPLSAVNRTHKPPDSHPPTGPPCFQQPWTQTTRYFPSNVAPTYSTQTPDKCLPDETPKRDNLYQPANSRGLAHPPSNSKTFCKPGNSLGLMHPHSVPVELARLKDLMHMCSLTHATQGLVKF